MALHQVIVHDASGNRLGEIPVTAFEYEKIVNWYGNFSVTGPVNEWPLEWRGLDYQYHFWRKPRGGEWAVDFVGIQRDRGRETHGAMTTVTVEGFDQNELLDRRVIAYAAGTAQAQKTNNIDDIMKAIVRENLGSDAVDGRNTTNTFRLTVAPDEGLAASITTGFAWQMLLETLRDLADNSAGQATGAVALFFEIALAGYNGNHQPLFQFRTKVGQPGINRTTSNEHSGFSLGNSNISNVRYERSYADEINFVYAGGLGLKDDRNVQSAGDTTRINASPINRRETFVSASHVEDADVLQVVYEELNAGRPTHALEATILDTETSPYQIAWGHGDKVSVFYDDGQFDEIIRRTQVRVVNKHETITGQFGAGASLGNPMVPMMRKLAKLEKAIKKAAAGAEFAKYMGTGSSVPTTTELPREGMYYLYDNGIARRSYYNLGGVIRYATLT